MAGRSELLTALRAADAAGDTAAAAAIARRLAGSVQTPAANTSDGAAGAGTGTPPVNAPDKLQVSEAGVLVSPKEQARRDFADKSWGVRNAAGFTGALTQLGQGVKQIFGGKVNPEDIERERMIGGEAPIGNIVGNISAMLLPQAAAARGLNAAGRYLPKLFQNTLKATTVPALAGAEGALQPVIGDESRAGNAALSATVGKAAELGGKMFTRTLTGLVKPSQDARELMDLGIQPTVHQGGTGLMSKIFGVGEEINKILGSKGTQRVSNEALEVAKGRAVPPGQTVMENPGRGVFATDLKAATDAGYDAVLNGRKIPVTNGAIGAPSSMGTMRANGQAALQHSNSASAINDFTSTLDNMYAEVQQAHNGVSSAAAWKDLQSRIRAQQREAQDAFGKSGNRDEQKMARAWQAADDHLITLRNKHLTPDEITQLEAVDNSVLHQKLLKDAVANAREGTAPTKVKSLIESVEKAKNTPQNLKITGEGAYQDITDPMKGILEQDANRSAISRKAAYLGTGAALTGGTAAVAGGPIGAAALATAMAMGKVGSTHTGAKAILGGFETQRKIAEFLRRHPAAIQAPAAAVGGSTTQRE